MFSFKSMELLFLCCVIDWIAVFYIGKIHQFHFMALKNSSLINPIRSSQNNCSPSVWVFVCSLAVLQTTFVADNVQYIFHFIGVLLDCRNKRFYANLLSFLEAISLFSGFSVVQNVWLTRSSFVQLPCPAKISHGTNIAHWMGFPRSSKVSILPLREPAK